VHVEGRGGSYHDYFSRFVDDYMEPFTPEPAYDRMVLDESAWLRNLAASRADHLFVAALPWNERVNHRHSPEGFVAEQEWARGRPELFEPRFRSAAAWLFAIGEAGGGREPSPPMQRPEVDAVELYLSDDRLLDRLYPGARAFIEQNRRLRDYARSRSAGS
jgi:hypothetical protein